MEHDASGPTTRNGSFERAVQRELRRPVEHHFLSPRVTPVDRAALQAGRSRG